MTTFDEKELAIIVKNLTSNALTNAAKNNNIDSVEVFIKLGANINKADEDGETPLYWAAWNGHTKMAKMLIEAEVDVNKANKYGRTPLYWAARGGYTEIAKMLIEAKADVNKADTDGRTPLHRAAKNEHLDIVTLLLCEKPTGVKELKDLPADSEDLIKNYLNSIAPKRAS